MNAVLSACVLLGGVCQLCAEAVRVRHKEGVTLGFLLLRNSEGQVIAHGELSQDVGREGVVTGHVRFQFADGSSYEEIAKFTQAREFHLVSDKVVQKGPSFKQETESFIDVASGTVKVRTREGGKDKLATKHFNLPRDLANGLLFTLVKNLDPAAPSTSVTFVANSSPPRLVKMIIAPGGQKTFKFGPISGKAQQFVVKVKIGGVAGMVAPLVGKQPPDTHVWILETAAPSFLQSEGPLTPDSPVWRIELAGPPAEELKNLQ